MLVSIALGYALIGAVLWVILDTYGVVQKVHDGRLARGAETTGAGLVMATMLVILGWPVFVAIMLRDWRRRA